MKRPTKEQIEKIKEELPHPRNWIGDFYHVAWQDPEDLKPINASTGHKCAKSYTVELLFKRVVDANGYDMSWELDEGFKSFDEFVAENLDTLKQPTGYWNGKVSDAKNTKRFAKQIEESQNPVDEYGIIEILKKHNAEGALNDITAVFDKFCESYMGSREKIRKGAFTEVNCCLMTALYESHDDTSLLRSKVEGLVDSYNDLYTGKIHANKAK